MHKSYAQRAIIVILIYTVFALSATTALAAAVLSTDVTIRSAKRGDVADMYITTTRDTARLRITSGDRSATIKGAKHYRDSGDTRTWKVSIPASGNAILIIPASRDGYAPTPTTVNIAASEPQPAAPTAPAQPQPAPAVRQTAATIAYPMSIAQAVEKQSSLSAKTDAGGRFVNASAAQIAARLDPASANKYQFLDLRGYSGASAAQLKTLSSHYPIGSLHYEEFFIAAAQIYNLNEVYLLAHAIHETGGKISGFKGTYNGEVVYNFFGIAAFDANVANMWKRAYDEGWTTPEAAIMGGAAFIAHKYVYSAYKQTTLYAMRWGSPTAYGQHQYATDVNWAQAIASYISKFYAAHSANHLKFAAISYAQA